jgi:enoyl-CoA hydratase/carnithine racemase
VINIERIGPVALVRLANGKVNALDVETLDELTGLLADLGRSDARAAVITGEGKVFSAGVDLFRYLDGGAAYAERLLPALSRAFETVFTLPVPTVAAVQGPAIAGGCILACACDRRLLADTAQIGATELAVGVAFPVAALEILRYACGSRAGEVILGAGLYQGAAAVEAGLVQEVVPAGTLLDQAVQAAEQLGGLGRAAFELAKAQLHRPVTDRIAADAASVDAAARRVWVAADTVASVRASLERTVRR